MTGNTAFARIKLGALISKSSLDKGCLFLKEHCFQLDIWKMIFKIFLIFAETPNTKR